MKTITYIFFLCFISAVNLKCTGEQKAISSFIIFEHIGIEDYPIIPLVICTDTSDIPTSKIDSIRKWPPHLRLVVTDKRTYNTFEKYINTRKGFFNLNDDNDHSFGKFRVIFENEIRYLPASKSQSFFKQAASYLKIEKADDTLITALNVVL